MTIWTLGLRAKIARGAALMIALFAASVVGRIVQIATHPGDDYRRNFNLVLPSEWLADHGARHLAFLWDGPTGAMSDPRRIGEVAGYFLRQRHSAAVTVLRAPGATVPAALVRTALRQDRSIDC